jgi:hypothetical protein
MTFWSNIFGFTFNRKDKDEEVFSIVPPSVEDGATVIEGGGLQGYYVDLDGTLTPVDTLVKIIIQLIKQSVLNIFKIQYSAIGGLANLKCEIAVRANISVEPYHIFLVLGFLKKKCEIRNILDWRFKG